VTDKAVEKGSNISPKQEERNKEVRGDVTEVAGEEASSPSPIGNPKAIEIVDC